MFYYANYYLNFSKLLGITKESKVDFQTSQKHILEMYRSGKEIPWDVRKPQPALEDAEREGLFKGLVLDAGCGFGDNAIFLAKKGYKVVGFDFSEEAVEIAKDRAKKSGVERDCEFFQADALNLDKSPLSGRKFQTILDSACLQCFDPKTQNDYINNIAPMLEGGGALVLLVVCNQSQLRSWCRGLRWMENHLNQLFCAESGWMIKDMLHTVFLENIPMVRINKGVRSFEPVTPSPCLRMVAVRPVRSKQLQVVVVASVLALAAGGLLLLLRRRAGAR
uniref:Methyltransferase domain-containing protein n=1 Tax=Hanusia phi TaxID=3032 RepID=A0A7S0EBE1_9CRYP